MCSPSGKTILETKNNKNRRKRKPKEAPASNIAADVWQKFFEGFRNSNVCKNKQIKELLKSIQDSCVFFENGIKK